MYIDVYKRQTPYEAMKEIAGENAAIEAYILDDEFGTTIPSDVILLLKTLQKVDG